MIAVTQRRRTVKAPAGVQPAWGNSLLNGLIAGAFLNEGGGLQTVDFRRRQQLTISSNITWVHDLHGLSLKLTGGSSLTHVDFGDASLFVPVSNATFVVQQRKQDSTNRNSLAFVAQNSATNQRCSCHLPFGDGKVYFDFGGASDGSTRLNVAGLTFGKDTFALTTGPRGMEIWQNGILRASNAGNPTRSVATGNFVLGGGSLDGGGVGCDEVAYSLFLMYNRQLSLAECQQVTTLPYTHILQPQSRTWAISAVAPVTNVANPLSGSINPLMGCVQ